MDRTEIRAKWVPDPFCLSTIATMLKHIGPNFSVCVCTCEQAVIMVVVVSTSQSENSTKRSRLFTQFAIVSTFHTS